MNEKNTIKSYKDLMVYNSSYEAMLVIFNELLDCLPVIEKYDFLSQISRSCKAIPRLIAEGYSKRHQNKGFQKYLYDALGETNETMVSLEQVKDIYHIKIELVNFLLLEYDKIGRQIYKLGLGWKNMKKKTLCT